MMRKLLSLLICVFSITLHASDNDMNFRIQLLLADEVVVGKIYNMELKGSGEHWFEYRIAVKTKDNDRKLLFYDAQEPTFSADKKDKIILVNHQEDENAGLPLILNNPIHSVYKIDDIKNIAIEKVIKESRDVGNTFYQTTSSCSRSFKKKIKNLAELSMQKSVDYLFKNKPLSREEFRCLADSIKSKSELKQRSFEPPFGANDWESHYFTPFTTLGELIAYMLPFLMDAPIGLASSDLSDKDRQKLTEAWLYWGAVKYGTH